MKEFLKKYLDRQPKPPAEPIEDVGHRALSSLDAIHREISEEDSQSDLSTPELAVRNLKFVNERISPAVQEYFRRTRISLEFGDFLSQSLIYSSAKGKLVIEHMPEVEQDTIVITEQSIRAMAERGDADHYWGEWARGFARTPKENLIEQFRGSINSSLDRILTPISHLSPLTSE